MTQLRWFSRLRGGKIDILSTRLKTLGTSDFIVDDNAITV